MWPLCEWYLLAHEEVPIVRNSFSKPLVSLPWKRQDNKTTYQRAIDRWGFGLNVCILPKYICWNLIPVVVMLGGGAFGTRWGHEGEAIMNRIPARPTETPNRSLALSIMRDCSRKTTGSETGRGTSPDTESASALIMDLQSSTVEDQCLRQINRRKKKKQKTQSFIMCTRVPIMRVRPREMAKVGSFHTF